MTQPDGYATAAPTSPAARWRHLAGLQAAQSRRLRARYGGTSADADEESAEPSAGPVVAYDDPFLARVLREVDRHSRVVDVGAGNGRLALALAPHVAEVVAVDPDSAALRRLADAADRLGIDNVRGVAARIEQTPEPRGEVAISAFVLDILPDAETFLARLDETATRRVFVCATAQSPFALYHTLWHCFHDEPRELGPSYLDAVAILRQLGADPDVDMIVRTGNGTPALDYASVAEAVESYREMLLLPPEPEIRDRLHVVLASWLARSGDGYADPIPSLPFAVIAWVPRAARQRARQPRGRDEP